MARQRPALRLLAGVAALYASAWGLREAARAWRRPVHLEAERAAYFHDEFVRLRLRTHDALLRERWRKSPPRACVLSAGVPVRTIAGVTWVDLVWDEGQGAFVARWPCPWNAPPGAYEIGLRGAGEDLGDRVRSSSFELRRRASRALPPGFVALTLETKGPLSAMRVPGPDGAMEDWRGLLDWAQYIEADAFWMLAGETPGTRPGELWRSENLALLPEVAEECRKRGLALGVYAIGYWTTSPQTLERYDYAWDVEEGRAKRTWAISLDDPRRPGDLAALLAGLAEIPGVDYVGLDYIRNVLGGYELIDDFFREMPGVRPPPEWGQLTREERMVWFHRKKVMRKDFAFIDAWQWWRAHRVAQIVRRVRAAIPEKSLWTFTLTWDKGWHHGQDVVMMNDAGADVDALMLYEADAAQFERILKDFHGYVRPPDAQLMVGDIVDWPLHQRSPLGPREMSRRLGQAVARVYADGEPAAGLFIHDAGRAIWGKRGPYSTRRWLDAAREAVRGLRRRARASRGFAKTATQAVWSPAAAPRGGIE